MTALVELVMPMYNKIKLECIYDNPINLRCTPQVCQHSKKKKKIDILSMSKLNGRVMALKKFTLEVPGSNLSKVMSLFHRELK